MIQNLPPKQWYQAVPECCDIEGFFGNFRPSTDARDWWTAQQARDVNNPQFRICRTDPEEGRRAIGERKMSGEKSEPTDQHKGIFECIQWEGESNRNWIKRHLRGVHAYRRKMEADAAKRTPQQPPKPKAAPTTVSSGHQPDDEDSDNGPMATVRQGQSTWQNQEPTPLSTYRS